MNKRRCNKIVRRLLLSFLLLTFGLPMGGVDGNHLFAASLKTEDFPGHQGPIELPAVVQTRPDKPGILTDRDGDGLSDGLQARLAEMLPNELIEVVVTFSKPGNADAAQQAAGPFRIKQKYKIINGFAATMTAAQARALSRAKGVFRVEEDFRVSTMLDASNADFGTASARSTFYVDGSDVGICVVDTGVDPDHEQLNDGKVVEFVDYVSGQTAAYDDQGHGTHVAAIAAGDGDPNSTFQGVAPSASIYAAKVLDWTGSGYESDVIAGVEWCANWPGVDVISMSLGSTGSSDGLDALSQAVNNAVAAGKTAVVAAGNSGAGPNTIGSPGAAEQAITVGAVAEWSAPPQASNHSDGVFLAWFSSRGPTADGRTKPDIVSPGVSVTSAQANSVNGYVTGSGTSMATPFVSGTVALALEALASQNKTLTPAELKSELRATAQDRGLAGWDNDWGAGLVDGHAFVAKALEASSAPTPFPAYQRVAGSVSNSGEWTWEFEVPEVALEVPLGLTLTIDGQPKCIFGFFGLCFAWEWSPDLDAELIAPDGSRVAMSTCMDDTECGGIGRQETLHLMPAVAGLYTVRVYPYAGSPNNGEGGNFFLDVSTGPLDDSGGGGSSEDTELPVVTDFELPDYSSSLTVQFVAFDATDNIDVTGYLTTETATAPAADNADWSAEHPTEHTFSVAGLQTLYGWAKDAAGNVSTATSESTDTVVIDTEAPVVTAFDMPATYELLQVPLIFEAEDVDTEVTGYLVKETSDVPAANDSGWTAPPAPTSYDFDSEGTKTLYGWAKDAAGNVSTAASDTVEITLESPPPATTMHIGDLDGVSVSMRNKWQAEVTVVVHDTSDNRVSNATISGTWSGGYSGNSTCTTDLNGKCLVASDPMKKKIGSTTFTVTGVSHVDYTYDASVNHDPDGDSDGTSITVSKP